MPRAWWRGSELFVATFDTFGDLLAGTLSAGTFSQLNIGANFGVGGFGFDGAEYQVLLESDNDRPAGSGIFLAAFDTFDDPGKEATPQNESAALKGRR